MTFKVPILLVTWRRRDAANTLIDALRQLKPAKIYVASDGPREGLLTEAEKVASTRESIMSNIDWDCEIKTRFSETNQGCRRGVSSAITWFFSNVEEGIILEDDCIPHPDFFKFCENLLNRYRHDESIGIITGYNLKQSTKELNSEYYFYAKHGGIWGWASWASRWKSYQKSIKHFKSDYINERYESLLSRAESKIRIHQLLEIILTKVFI